MGNFALALMRSHDRRTLRQTEATKAVLDRHGKSMTQSMKSRHPWQNRTGDAEKSVGAVVDKPAVRGAETVLTLRVGYVLPPFVKYGIWLELARAGAFSIVRSTVSRERASIGRDIAVARHVR